MNTTLTFTVPEDATKQRVDSFMQSHVEEDLSRARIQALMKEGHLTVNGSSISQPSHKVHAGDEVQLKIPPTTPTTLLAEEIPLEILHEDTHLIVLNKPAGLTVHPAPGNRHGTLVNALLFHCPHLMGIGGVERPGIVHRLDKDTSGIMVVAKDDLTHRHLAAQFKEHSIQRQYLALCYGVFRPQQGTIVGNIGRSPSNRKKMAVVKHGGKTATTHYETQDIYANSISLVRFQLETGRTHQIRVHSSHVGCPVVGDPAYSRTKKFAVLSDEINAQLKSLTRQMLHAEELGFVHPHTEETLHFTTPPPADMQNLIDLLTETC